MRRFNLALAFFLACLLIQLSPGTPTLATPDKPRESPEGKLTLAAPLGHSHNDYYQDNPLHTALDAGMLSIEADVFLRDGKLMVAHDPEEIRDDRTLESLYLDPLWQRFEKHGGTQPDQPFGGAVRECGNPVVLMVDFKNQGHAAWQALEALLANYPGLARHIQHPDDDTTQPPTLTPGPVIVVVSGDRPIRAIQNAPARYCGYDGRWPNDENSNDPAHLMPMISMSAYTLVELSKLERAPSIQIMLKQMSQSASKQGRLARVWATPDTPEAWEQLHNANMQLINTDQPTRLSDWLAAQQTSE